MQNLEFKSHDIRWTSQKISRFWEYYNSNPALETNAFEYQAGKQIINFASRFIKLGGNILNYGAGRGFLIGYLLDGRRIQKVSSCDFSKEAVNVIEKKFKGNAKFDYNILIENFPSKLPAGYFDIVFLLDTIEHLRDSEIDATLVEINRVLKQNGFIVATTRNKEDLEALKTICPDCGCVFSRIQHMRSFDKNSIGSLMQKYGFKEIFNGGDELVKYKIRRPFFHLFKNTVKKILKKNIFDPNLIYIGQKE